MNVIVRWNNSLSDVLRVRSGVRQGGVLSPYLFNVYADVFINNIVTRGRGCHIRQTCMACVMYADDLLLLSASLAGLQELLDVCILSSDLGMELMASSSFDTDLDQTRRKFYVSVNTILRHCSGASELMKLYLCESYCLQVLMYAVESLNLCTTAVRKLNV